MRRAKAKRPTIKYQKATADMISVVQEVVDKQHQRLDGLKIAVISKTRATRAKGRTILATASLMSARLRPLLKENYAFVICIAAAEWEALSKAKRVALIDHELCHCALDSHAKPGIRPHDYEEFMEIVARHGFWRGDLAESALQLSFTKAGVKVGTIGDAEPAVDAQKEVDELMELAKAVILESGRATTALVQRRLRIGYTAAADLMDKLEAAGIIGPPRGSDPREILVSKDTPAA